MGSLGPRLTSGPTFQGRCLGTQKAAGSAMPKTRTPRTPDAMKTVQKGLGFRVSGFGFKVWGLGFGVWGLGFRA